MYLYSMVFDAGRQGRLSGLFITTERGKAVIDYLVDHKVEIGFGDALGKHSDVYGYLTTDEFTILETTPEQIQSIIDVFYLEHDPKDYPFSYTISGYNPIDYIDPEEYECQNQDTSDTSEDTPNDT